MEEKKYTYGDLLSAINYMEDEKKEFLLRMINDFSLVLDAMNTEEQYERARKYFDDTITFYKSVKSHLQELKEILDSGIYRKNEEMKENNKVDKEMNRVGRPVPYNSLMGWYSGSRSNYLF